MNTVVYVLFLGLTIAIVLIGGGNVLESWRFLLGVAMVLAIPLYFGTRNTANPASATERALALMWIWFRQIVCVGIASICLVLAGAIFWLEFLKAPTWQTALGSLGLLVASALIVGLGLFGYATDAYGDNAGAWRAYLSNKKRYARRSKNDI